MYKENRPIGFFDSGVGGISVLKEAIKLMPEENYIYFGDSKNAPYGTKSVEEVKELSFKAAEYLIDKKVKAIVVACNTATSAAISDMRKIYDIPIIGIEPALKPAVNLKRDGKVIIMATPMTLAEKKFNNLMKKYAKNADIYQLPCPGLVELIEEGRYEGTEVKEYLEKALEEVLKHKIAAVVLGCTHYPFIKGSLRNIIGNEISIIDGGRGTSKQLKRKLKECHIKRDTNEKGEIKIFNSGNEKIFDLSIKLLNL